MKLSLKAKYTVAYLLTSVSLLLLLNTYGHKSMYHHLLEQEQEKLYEEAELIVRDYVPDMNVFTSSNTTLIKHFRSLQTLTDMRVWLASASGEILLDSSSINTCQGENINKYDASFLSNQSVTGKKPVGLVDEEMISVIFPITKSIDTTGYVILMSPSGKLSQKAVSYLDSIIVCCFIMLTLLGALFFYLYHHTVRPLKALTNAAKSFADGQFNTPVCAGKVKEFEDLSNAIRYLADNMNHLTDYQTKFIANVSHDFRSPLTSIKGYTQALADGVIPPEMQEKYFQIILFEVERLNKLTGNLLEINTLENGKIPLELTVFDINRTIKETSAPFEQRCAQKRISLNLLFDSKTQPVNADMAKIQQVIHNLLDNAIKFSPNDSVIEVHISEKNQKVFISIKDHGIGIPKDSLGKIWSRFYKTDLSRGKDKTGTGLGLSITKEIIEAHNENINVISTEGVGTEFIFSLSAGK